MITDEWISLPDGRRLAARLYRPDAGEPVPALLELHPYGSRGPRAIGDPPRHGYLAAHGYACARVDLAGSGESDGVLRDEYLRSEIDDGVEVIAWLARQAWCTGAVGMFGISWGGFNSLAVAARRPPALRAIVSACASDDRYADDVHYYGGCVLGLEMLSWSTTMLALLATPPDPEIQPRGWQQRLAAIRPMVETWLAHQRRDSYWEQSSVGVNYAEIACPVLLIGGWADGYRDGALRLLANLPGPARAIVGPWGHAWPDQARPGPEIGILDEMLRWWDQWLKGRNTGVLDDPPLRAWLQTAVRPAVAYAYRPGRWVGQAWPSRSEGRVIGLGSSVEAHLGRLTPASEPGPWCAAGRDVDFAGDQQGEDGQSLCFTLEPLDRPIEILGSPTVRLRVAADRPVALVAVRLCDVWPDGASTLITRGALNLTHRRGHDTVAPLTPGSPVEVTVGLQAAGYVVPIGHRLRVSISSAYWPLLWPSPDPVTLEVDAKASAILLPVLDGSATVDPHISTKVGRAPSPDFELLAGPDLAPSTRLWPATGRSEVTWPRGGPGIALPDGIRYTSAGHDSFSVVEGDPTTAQAVSLRQLSLVRRGSAVQVEARAEMGCTREEFLLEHTLEVVERDGVVASKRWESRLARDGV
jgi:predicted acyl esterase